MNYEPFTGEAQRSSKMKRNFLVLAVMVAAVLFLTPHNTGAQYSCYPYDQNPSGCCGADSGSGGYSYDLGICDTLYVETFDCDSSYEAELGSFDSVRVAIYVTHDSNT
ncbi:MAG: hypothetical protein KAW52_02905, partial [candidate division Zixibacteria bacterium]|nr:hypothetical protein [candidate division Zixibacteria bacterium]